MSRACQPTRVAHPRGQSLLEATLAIGIILVGLGALLALTLQNIAAATESSQRVTAAHLAREGLEVARGIRDSNWLAENNNDPTRQWHDDLTPVVNGGYAVEFTLPTDFATPAEFTLQQVGTRNVNESWQFFRAGADDFYVWVQAEINPVAGWEPTGYRRLLILDWLCQQADGTIALAHNAANCPGSTFAVGLRARSAVSWPSGKFGGRRQLELVEYLYNWR